MRPRANIFSMQQYLVVSYVKPANHAPGVQIGHAPGVISSQTYNWEKKNLLWNHEGHS